MSVYENYKDYGEFQRLIEEVSVNLELDPEDVLLEFNDVVACDYIESVFVGASTWSHDWQSERRRDDNRLEIYANLVSLEKFYERIAMNYGDDEANGFKECIREEYKEYKYCIRIETYDSIDYIEFFNDLEVAEAELRGLEHSEKPYVETYIKEFEDKLSEKTHAFVEVEFDECKQDFKISLYGDKLIIDNAKQLEDEEIGEILSYLEFEKELDDKYDIRVTECEKYKHDIGFTRGYHITFEKYGIEIEKDIEMDGYNSSTFLQGNQRTLKDILEYNLDIDSLLEEFEKQAEIEAKYD